MSINYSPLNGKLELQTISDRRDFKSCALWVAGGQLSDSLADQIGALDLAFQRRYETCDKEL